MTAKHYKANCKSRPANAARVTDARTLARISKVEDELWVVCRHRGLSFDSFSRDNCNDDAWSLDGARAHRD